MRKFKLTGAFLVIAAVTFVIAAIIILRVSDSQEERSVAAIATELRSRGFVSGPSAEGLVVGVLERHRLI